MNPDPIMTTNHLIIVLSTSGCAIVDLPILFQEASIRIFARR